MPARKPAVGAYCAKPGSRASRSINPCLCLHHISRKLLQTLTTSTIKPQAHTPAAAPQPEQSFHSHAMAPNAGTHTTGPALGPPMALNFDTYSRPLDAAQPRRHPRLRPSSQPLPGTMLPQTPPSRAPIQANIAVILNPPPTHRCRNKWLTRTTSHTKQRHERTTAHTPPPPRLPPTTAQTQ